MVLNVTVLNETTQNSSGREFVTVTGIEQGPKPLLQMVDYGLRADELAHKGKLVGKVVTIQVESVRALFAGRPQLVGRIESVNGGK